MKLLEDLDNFAPPHELLPDVSKRVNEILTLAGRRNFRANRVRQLASGLELLINHDYEFSESETGKKILDVVNLMLN